MPEPIPEMTRRAARPARGRRRDASRVTLRVWRGDPGRRTSRTTRSTRSRARSCSTSCTGSRRRRRPTSPCRWNCKAGKCGSCSAEINGRPRLMCMTRIDELDDGADHRRADADVPDHPGPRHRRLVQLRGGQADARVQPRAASPRAATGCSRSTSSGAGVPQVHRVLLVPGRLPRHPRPRGAEAALRRAAVLHPARRARDAPARHERPPRARAASAMGLGLCNITKCCTEVCPEHIQITDNAIIPLKERVVGAQLRPGRVARPRRRGARCRASADDAADPAGSLVPAYAAVLDEWIAECNAALAGRLAATEASVARRHRARDRRPRRRARRRDASWPTRDGVAARRGRGDRRQPRGSRSRSTTPRRCNEGRLDPAEALTEGRLRVRGDLRRSSMPSACSPGARRTRRARASVTGARRRWSVRRAGPGRTGSTADRAPRSARREPRDEVQRHVDARRDTRGRDHVAVVDEAHVTAHVDRRVERLERVERRPVRRRRGDPEQPRGGVGRATRCTPT